MLSAKSWKTFRLRLPLTSVTITSASGTLRSRQRLPLPLALRITNGQLRNWLKPVASKADYIEALRIAILNLHNTDAIWRYTVPVHEKFRGRTVWNGEVEVFDLVAHPKAKRAFAWAKLEGQNDETTKFVTVLEIPPVVSARNAVQASIMADSPKPKS